MHYHRRPAFALLVYIFQPYLKAISEIRLINTALAFSFPSSEWMKGGVQSYSELWPCQEHFLWFSIGGYASENSFQMSRAWKPILHRFASSTFHSPSIHKLFPEATQWKIALSTRLPSTLEKVAKGQTNCPDGSRRRNPVLLRGAGSACEQMADTRQAALGHNCCSLMTAEANCM